MMWRMGEKCKLVVAYCVISVTNHAILCMQTRVKIPLSSIGVVPMYVCIGLQPKYYMEKGRMNHVDAIFSNPISLPL